VCARFACVRELKNVSALIIVSVLRGECGWYSV
jgi:hypothetical protein